jgi:hypothetical protein
MKLDYFRAGSVFQPLFASNPHPILGYEGSFCFALTQLCVANWELCRNFVESAERCSSKLTEIKPHIFTQFFLHRWFIFFTIFAIAHAYDTTAKMDASWRIGEQTETKRSVPKGSLLISALQRRASSTTSTRPIGSATHSTRPTIVIRHATATLTQTNTDKSLTTHRSR